MPSVQGDAKRAQRKRDQTFEGVVPKEKPVDTSGKSTGENMGKRRALPGSISFVPPVAGLLIAGEVIRTLIGVE